MKKKILSVITSIIILLSLFNTVSASDNIKVYINGELQNYSNPPKMVNNRVLVPMRAIFESLGATIEWNSANRTVLANGCNRTISLTIDSNYATINNNKQEIDTPAQIINNNTFVPLRFVGEALGADVMWDGNNKTINITPNPECGNVVTKPIQTQPVQVQPTIDLSKSDYNCSDFKTQAEAKAVFEAAGGLNGNDPYRLDTDGDLRVCESLK